MLDLRNIHHRDSIVHQRFDEDENLKDFVNVYFFNNGQHCHLIHGGDKRGENDVSNKEILNP